MAGCDIKLYYFNLRGRAEFIRMLLIAAGQEFEDHRCEPAEWAPPNSQARQDSPYGQLPYIIYKGKKYGQSLAIGTYLAKKFGYYGETDEDAFRQEEAMHLLEDASVPHIREWIMEPDPEKKEAKEQKLREKHFPRYLTYLEALLKDNGDTGFFVGQSITLADLCLYNFLDTVLVVNPEALEPFPLARKLRANVEAIPALETYIRNRAPNKI